MPAGAKITVELPNGQKETYVKATKQQIIQQNYGNLIGQPITVTDAAEKYKVQRRLILEWKQIGYVAVIKDGYKMELDEADVAYCAGIHHKRNGISGAPLLDGDGLPYMLRRPDLSEYRAKKRKQLA